MRTALRGLRCNGLLDGPWAIFCHKCPQSVGYIGWKADQVSCAAEIFLTLAIDCLAVSYNIQCGFYPGKSAHILLAIRFSGNAQTSRLGHILL
jgi:hypothetical protein